MENLVPLSYLVCLHDANIYSSSSVTCSNSFRWRRIKMIFYYLISRYSNNSYIDIFIQKITDSKKQNTPY